MPTQEEAVDEIENQMGLFEIPKINKAGTNKPAAAKKPIERSAAVRKVIEKAEKQTVRRQPVTSLAKRGGSRKPAVKAVSGLVPEGDVRLTANIRQDLHLKLKIAAAYRRTTIGEMIEEMIEKYVPKH